MGTPALNPDNVIKLWTRNGDCEIQLLYGDITMLPLEQKMDILMVSAFPGTIFILINDIPFRSFKVKFFFQSMSRKKINFNTERGIIKVFFNKE